MRPTRIFVRQLTAAAVSVLVLATALVVAPIPARASAGLARQLVARYGDDVVDRFLPFGDDALVVLSSHGDEAAKLTRKHGDQGVEFLIRHEDDGIELLRQHGDRVLDLSRRYGDDAVELVRRYGDEGALVIERHGRVAIDVVRRHGQVAIDVVQRHGHEGLAWMSTHGDEITPLVGRLGLPAVDVVVRHGKPGLQLLRWAGPHGVELGESLAKRDVMRGNLLARRTFDERHRAALSGLLRRTGARGLAAIWPLRNSRALLFAGVVLLAAFEVHQVVEAVADSIRRVGVSTGRAIEKQPQVFLEPLGEAVGMTIESAALAVGLALGGLVLLAIVRLWQLTPLFRRRSGRA